ncbi:hypothetical protein CYMTET_21934 [Cymbomonas tetramitiformis]|uniref:Anaphase-promoting complex subunit 2 n=1 Tax=Cymbomonas tetramitiformis TaxID=36881 RepID=A0AAE0L2R0_9CHLO|nr:hypothetical protein CYMTET_21934 [Cymbomonas tetramitiformis]
MDITALAVVEGAWNSYLSVLDSEPLPVGTGSQPSPLPFGAELALLGSRGQTELVVAHYTSTLEKAFRRHYLPQFWQRFEGIETENANTHIQSEDELITDRGSVEEALAHGLQELSATVQRHEARVNELAAALSGNGMGFVSDREHPSSQFRTMLSALLVTTAPSTFAGLLQLYFSQRLQDFSHKFNNAAPGEAPQTNEEEDVDRMEGVEGAGGASLALQTLGLEWERRLSAVAQQLRDLALGAVSEEAYTNVLKAKIEARLRQEGANCFEVPVLAPALKWLQAVPMAFLRIILPEDPQSPVGQDTQLIQWQCRLQWLVYETLGSRRTAELFDIIVDYPESGPAVEDLQQCLQNTNHHKQVVASFRAALHRRLLHPGAATNDILTQFVSTIRVLRALDPAGVLLAAVRGPLQRYLRARKDTIRCIVTMLTDDGTGGGGVGGAGGESLLEELGSSGKAEMDDCEGDLDVSGDGAQVDDTAAEEWMPEAVDAEPRRTSRSRWVTDIISMLIAIYGSKELLVNEYRALLAERLLAKEDYATERELRTLELLKLRFGETNMHNCEVMLRDIKDSKRVNENVKTPGMNGALATPDDVQQAKQLKDMDATILSELFWPSLTGAGKEEILSTSLPEKVQKKLDVYASRYHTLKAPRKLKWHPQLGTVKMDLTFDDGRTMTFDVSPLHAVIICKFEEQPEWLAGDLATTLQVSAAVLRNKVVLWVNHGVLMETRSADGGDVLYSMVEYREQLNGSDAGRSIGSQDDVDLRDASDEEQRQRDLVKYDSLVRGLLTNYGALRVDRIHGFLVMMASDNSYDKTVEQLDAVLAHLVRENKLAVDGE